ncbi:MAG: hypothetical protein HY720_26290, partial [Planctomycetes bacterium]|nr:hypothetical protein [Planctomycetota bacterium]
MIHHFRTILGLAVALGLGYVVAHVLLPWTIRRVLKLLGREIRLSPIWRRRLQRFRSIRRGYWAFVAITSAFTSSLFLEFYINDQALLIVYKGKWASPAFRQWADLWLPWDVPHFLPANEWGLEHEGPIKYREYQRYCNEPGAFAERIRSAEKMLEDSRTRFAEMEEPKLPPEPVRPESDDPFDLELYETDRLVWDAEKAKLADKIREYEFRRDDLVEQAALVETLRGNESAFEGGQAWVLLPVYPYGPGESLLDLAGRPPHPPLTE